VLTLAGRAALVTGGGRGIGRAISELLARLGAEVAVNYRGDRAAAEATAAAIRAGGGKAIALQADLARPEEAERLVGEVVTGLGRLDLLVANHGIWKRASVAELTPAVWDETIRTNLTGVLAVCRQAALHMMPRRSGTMVLIASTSGQRGEAHYAHYSASKGAILALTKSLAAELAPHGIRVNAVAPGRVLTDMTRTTLEGPEAAEAVAPIPRGRAGTPDEIAGPVAFLASDLSSYLYGEVLCVNGGAVMAD
jgi:3-oxoacyl-[acyl-carrier protein] reductase